MNFKSKKRKTKRKGSDLILPSKSCWKIEMYRLGLVIFSREERSGEVEPESAGNVIEMNVGDAVVVFLFFSDMFVRLITKSIVFFPVFFHRIYFFSSIIDFVRIFFFFYFR